MKFFGAVLLGLVLSTVLNLATIDLFQNVSLINNGLSLAFGAVIAGYLTGKRGWKAGLWIGTLNIFLQALPALAIFGVIGGPLLGLTYFAAAPLFAGMIIPGLWIPMAGSLAIGTLAGWLGGWARVKHRGDEESPRAV